MVEEIEELEPNAQGGFFRQLGVFENAKVCVEVVGSAKRVPSLIAVQAGRCCKTGKVQTGCKRARRRIGSSAWPSATSVAGRTSDICQHSATKVVAVEGRAG